MFVEFKKAIQSRLGFLIENSCALFEVSIDRDSFWDLYLDSFPEGTNNVYRERREFDCSCCRQFVKNYGSIIGIVDGKVVSIWDVEVIDPFQTVANALKEHILSLPIANVFYSKFEHLGTDKSHELQESTTKTWNHFYYKLPANLVDKSSKSIESLQGSVRQTKDVIFRSLKEITPSVIETVLELIADKALYRGEEHKQVLLNFQAAQQSFITAPNKDAFAWETAVGQGRFLAIRNTAIGTLLINLSEGMNLETAVKKYEAVVAPSNYKRPKPLFTASMRKSAEEKVAGLGLMNSLSRRYAKLEDISVSDVIWASGESVKVMKTPFDLLANDDQVKIGSFKHIKEIGVESFIKDILPEAETLELMVENTHQNNLVSLIAPVNEDAPSLFKWSNGFGWAYNGDFTDSIKESVKSRGGKVDGVFRFSLSWAEGNSSDNSDLDAHCIFPGGHISYQNTVHSRSRGNLDVDIIDPSSYAHKDIVENITWPVLDLMPKGQYKFFVRNYSLRGRQNGFKAEVEFNGTIHSFHYDKGLDNKEDVDVVTVDFDGKNFKVLKSLPSTQATKEVWGISTMKFMPVSAVMFSPNHWGDQSIGNKHYFFMLQDCVNQGSPRGFFNEFLRSDLNEHRKVFEALGAKMKVQHTEDQLSGVGFSSTMKNSVIVKVNSQSIKIKFTEDELILKSTMEQVEV